MTEQTEWTWVPLRDGGGPYRVHARQITAVRISTVTYIKPGEPDRQHPTVAVKFDGHWSPIDAPYDRYTMDEAQAVAEQIMEAGR